jgi:hypothetical protein
MIMTIDDYDADADGVDGVDADADADGVDGVDADADADGVDGDGDGDEGDHLYSTARLARRPLCVALCHSSSFANLSPERLSSSAVAMHKTCSRRGFEFRGLTYMNRSIECGRWPSFRS